jgi:hypothetical protein
MSFLIFLGGVFFRLAFPPRSARLDCSFPESRREWRAGGDLGATRIAIDRLNLVKMA